MSKDTTYKLVYQVNIYEVDDEGNYIDLLGRQMDDYGFCINNIERSNLDTIASWIDKEAKEILDDITAHNEPETYQCNHCSEYFEADLTGTDQQGECVCSKCMRENWID